jgi:hypothetical protein
MVLTVVFLQRQWVEAGEGGERSLDEKQRSVGG